MMNEERSGFSFGAPRGGMSHGQQFQRRGDVSSHVVYKNSKMNKKDLEKK
jgi:hypothetical protein